MDYIKQLVKRFFQYEARLVLKRYRPKVIAITGSVGKSLTKEAIYSVLSKRFFVRKSEKSFTAELGVALTIIGCPSGTGSMLNWLSNLMRAWKLLLWKNPYPEYLILEIDGDKPGDLSGVSSFLRPDILAVTAIGEVPSHIELFRDLESFLFEKRTIINAVKRDGVIIYNMDDQVTSSLLQNVDVKKVSCGIGNGADYFGTEMEILYGNEKTKPVPTGMTFEIKNGDETNRLTIFESIGLQNEYATILAFAVGDTLNVPRTQMVTALNKFKALPGRMNIVPGIKETTIIDDTYNSSPAALSQALSVFSDLKTKGKKIVVVGDMLELGKYSAEEHKRAAELLNGRVDVVICVGIRARKISEVLLDLGFSEKNILSADRAEEAGLQLQSIIEEGDVILVKGSQAMRMERVVEEVMRWPGDKGEILVRQEEEWLAR